MWFVTKSLNTSESGTAKLIKTSAFAPSWFQSELLTFQHAPSASRREVNSSGDSADAALGGLTFYLQILAADNWPVSVSVSWLGLACLMLLHSRLSLVDFVEFWIILGNISA